MYVAMSCIRVAHSMYSRAKWVSSRNGYGTYTLPSRALDCFPRVNSTTQKKTPARITELLYPSCDFTCIFIQTLQIKFLVSCPQPPWSHTKTAIIHNVITKSWYIWYLDGFQRRILLTSILYFYIL